MLLCSRLVLLPLMSGRILVALWMLRWRLALLMARALPGPLLAAVLFVHSLSL